MKRSLEEKEVMMFWLGGDGKDMKLARPGGDAHPIHLHLSAVVSTALESAMAAGAPMCYLLPSCTDGGVEYGLLVVLPSNTRKLVEEGWESAVMIVHELAATIITADS